MTRQEIEHQLLTLSPSDKAEIVQSLTKALRMSGKGITKTPGVCSGVSANNCNKRNIHHRLENSFSQ
jgi:hypothetical protein